MGKAKQPIYISSSLDNVADDDEDEEESDSYLGQEDEEDDSESKEEEDESESQEEEYEYEESESDQKGDVESEWSSAEDEDYESNSEDQSDEDDGDKGYDQKEGKPTDEDLCDKVVNLLRQRNQKLDVLKLVECKAYLRKHDLMISGTKATCIQRIIEHWRLKDGNGERWYPKSSFTINCTGDVCKGDVVMFQQQVYDKFNKVSRNGKVIAKRTIAGRVVKESYGSAKQQHTFTVEVLWSKGVKPLPLLYPLLVKGRNLYRYRTFRQHWGNEAERSKVLEEKHRRGATARHARASTKARISAGSKRQRNLTDSRPKHQIKRLKKHSEAPTPRTQHQKTYNNKHIANHSKNFKTKTSSNTNRRPTNQSEKEAKPLHFSATQRPNFQHIYENSHPVFHQRNKISAPQTGSERFLIPLYNYDQNAVHTVQLMNGGSNIERSHSVYSSRFDRRRGDSSHSQSSSGRYFTPDAYDQRYVGFQFHGRNQFWP